MESDQEVALPKTLRSTTDKKKVCVPLNKIRNGRKKCKQ